MKKLKQWHQTRFGLLVFALVEAVGAYIFTTLAINSAHTWQWALAVVLAVGTLQNVGRLIWKLTNGNKQTSRTRQT